MLSDRVISCDDRSVLAVCISYNQPTYLKSITDQLFRITDRILVIDNASTFPVLLNLLLDLEKRGVEVLRMDRNYGHKVYLEQSVRNHIEVLSEKSGWYILTDPDLILPEENPLPVLSFVALEFGSDRVGLALEIDHPEILKEIRSNYRNPYSRPMQEWEGFLYLNPVVSKSGLPVYRANVDTTFCLIDLHRVKSLEKEGRSQTEIFALGNQYRVGGILTAKHRPWYKGWKSELLPGEYEAYKKENLSTNYFN